MWVVLGAEPRSSVYHGACLCCIQYAMVHASAAYSVPWCMPLFIQCIKMRVCCRGAYSLHSSVEAKRNKGTKSPYPLQVHALCRGLNNDGPHRLNAWFPDGGLLGRIERHHLGEGGVTLRQGCHWWWALRLLKITPGPGSYSACSSRF